MILYFILGEDSFLGRNLTRNQIWDVNKIILGGNFIFCYTGSSRYLCFLKGEALFLWKEGNFHVRILKMDLNVEKNWYRKEFVEK